MFSSFHNHIDRSKRIFLTSHSQCPDATGSICALIEYLWKEGKYVYPYLHKSILPSLKHLPHASSIVVQKPDLTDYDTYLIVDTGDLKQTGIAYELDFSIKQNQKSTVINIDHHVTNVRFGDVNIIDSSASSTCEILYNLIHERHTPISKECAYCLLTGIVGDTSNFTNAATNQEAFKIAAELIWCGANIFDIIQRLFSVEESINTLRLWGKIFERLTYNKKYDIAVSYVLQKDFVECNVAEESVEVVANFLNYIKGVKGGVLLKETADGAFKVSMRTTSPYVDVSLLAKMLGGGGHRKAAGFSVGLDTFGELDLFK